MHVCFFVSGKTSSMSQDNSTIALCFSIHHIPLCSQTSPQTTSVFEVTTCPCYHFQHVYDLWKIPQVLFVQLQHVIEGSYTSSRKTPSRKTRTFPQKTLDQMDIISNVHFPELTFVRMHISLNVHFPEITFLWTYTFQNIHLDDWTFSRKPIFQNWHLPECTFGRMGISPKTSIPELTLARMYVWPKQHLPENLFSRIDTCRNVHLAKWTFSRKFIMFYEVTDRPRLGNVSNNLTSGSKIIFVCFGWCEIKFVYIWYITSNWVWCKFFPMPQTC